MAEEKVELEKIKVLKIKGDEFTFDITQISVNDYLSIENEKIRLTGGNYAQIATSLLASSFTAANIIDMISTYRVLNSKIEDCVPTKDFSKLCIIDIKELLEIYSKEFAPWYSAWMKEFNSPFVPEEVKKDGDSDAKQ